MAPRIVSKRQQENHDDAQVPEPSTIALLGLGLLGMGFRRRLVS